MLLNNAVCLSYLFIKSVNHILDMASYNRDKFIPPVTIVSKYVMEKNQCMTYTKRSLKTIDRLRSAYVNAVLSALVRIMMKYMRKAEKQKGCSARLRLNKSIVTSTMLFKPRFCFVFSNYHSSVYSTIRFCYGIKYLIIS